MIKPNRKIAKLVTVNRAAELLSCHPKTIRRLVDDEELQGCKVRNALRITANSLDDYVKRQIMKFQTRYGLIIDKKKESDEDCVSFQRKVDRLRV